MHQEALRCLLSIGLLLFLNRKTKKKKHQKAHQKAVGEVNSRQG
jgi:hypothetical protein